MSEFIPAPEPVGDEEEALPADEFEMDSDL